MKKIIPLTITILLLQVLQAIIKDYNQIDLKLFQLGEFIIICFSYLIIFHNYSKGLILTIITCLLSIIYTTVVNNHRYDEKFTPISISFSVLILSVTYFRKLLLELPVTHIHQFPMFWINSSFFFYHTGLLAMLVLNLDAMVINFFKLWLSTTKGLLILAGLYYYYTKY